jgi:hypothetical protein
VVAHALGYDVLCISRVGNTVCPGHVRTSAIDSPHDNALVTAGGAALAYLARVAVPLRGCARDRQIVREMSYDWPEAVDEARELLTKWAAVAKLVVVTLRTRPRLDAAAFADVVGGRALPS